MKSNTKDKKAKEYAASIAEVDRQWGCKSNIYESSMLIQSYKAGWCEALKNQWIKVEDELPKSGVNVLVLTNNGKILVTFRYVPKDIYGKILGKTEWNGSRALGNSILAWMPIPSFDKILEDNKDIYKRLKDK